VTQSQIMIREANSADWPVIWAMISPVFRAGETYAVDPQISENEARALWVDAPVATYLAIGTDGTPLGTYYIKKNFSGAADHICNCGYITSEAAAGRGVATVMCQHSQDAAREHGFGLKLLARYPMHLDIPTLDWLMPI